MGGQSDWMILEDFSNLGDSMILWSPTAWSITHSLGRSECLGQGLGLLLLSWVPLGLAWV